MDSDLPNGTLAFRLTNESHFDFIVTLTASWAMSLFCKETVKILLNQSPHLILHIIKYIVVT